MIRMFIEHQMVSQTFIIMLGYETLLYGAGGIISILLTMKLGHTVKWQAWGDAAGKSWIDFFKLS